MGRRQFDRLWTIQPLEVWQSLEKRGTLLADPAHPRYEGEPPEAYHWLTGQLRERLPQFHATLPWWAYCRKPDLRWARHTLPRGSRHVRLEIRPRRSSYFTFPCWAWTLVFSSQFLARTAEEHRLWLRDVRRAGYTEWGDELSEELTHRVRKSWESLFDPNLPRRSWDPDEPRTECFEAALARLHLDEVQAMTHFQGARRS
ncbi:MAG: DUF3841 domain-containing protein [Planctomycetota bacterium]